MIWAVSGAVIALAFGFYLYGRNVSAPTAPGEEVPFAVDASALAGKVQLSWRPEQPQVRAASSGVITVVDGRKLSTYPIDRPALQAGTWGYANQTDDVALSLTLIANNVHLAEAMVRTVSPITPLPPVVDVKPAPTQTAAKAAAKPTKPTKPAKPKKVKATTSRNRTKPTTKKTLNFTPHY